LLTALASAPLLSGQAAGGAAAGDHSGPHSALREPQIVSGPDGLQLEQLVQIMNEQNEALMENYRQIAQKKVEMVPPGISDRW